VNKVYFTNYKLELARNTIFSSLKKEKHVNIFDVIELSSGEYLPKSKMEHGKHQVYGGGGPTDSKHSDYNIEKRTLGIGRVGARCGCAFIINPKSWVTDNALFISKLKAEYDFDFLMHYFNFINLNQFANQSAQPVISQKGIAKCSIPKIDIKYQRQIAETLTAIESGNDFDDVFDIKAKLKIERDLSNLQNELLVQMKYIQLLRQSILQEAVQGKLVPQDPKDEPASELHEYLIKKKERLNKNISKPSTIKLPYKIPKNWEWFQLGEIILFTDNLNIEKELPSDTLINYVDIDAIDNRKFEISESKLKRVSELSSRARRILRKGYIVYSLVRPYLNNIAIVKDDKPNYIGSTGLAVFKGIKVNDYYLKYLLLSPYIRKLYLNMLSGFNSPSITQQQFTSTLVPIPPLNEQKRIVAKVEQLMKYCDELEQQINQSKADAERLLQTVLREAFQGGQKSYSLSTEPLSMVAEP
jgi:restriction endonuclease S subunit